MEIFGQLLRRHRLAAVLTQESLAERAGISATGIAALEAGRRRAPRASTIALLLDALDLDHAARTELIAAAAATPDVHSSPARSAFESTPTTSRFGGNFPGVHRKFSFVDRPAELSQLHGAWHSKARALFVYGEAGAGKTRLVGEFAAGMQPAAGHSLGALHPRSAWFLRAVR